MTTDEKTASMDKIKAELKPWTSRAGETRYYVNNWKDLAGISVEYYNSGNVRSVVVTDLKGEEQDMSNSKYGRTVASGKVYFDETGKVHVDYMRDDETEQIVKNEVTKHFM